MEENNDSLINKYILKLNDNISELTKKNIVLEVQLEMKNDELTAKDNETAEWGLHLRQELNAEFQERLAEVEKNNRAELDAVIAQRQSLQEECNTLRAKYAKLEDAYLTLTEKQVKKKKTVSSA
jgi:hypothetical protein